MAVMIYEIAFDPGMTAVGCAIWEDGTLFKLETLIPKGADHLAKLMSLQVKLNKFYLGLLNVPGSSVETVIVEEWERFIPKFKLASMMKSAEGRGILISVSTCYCQDIRFISKGKVKKQEAQMLAKGLGVTGSSHAVDAFHLGLLAGFGKNSQSFLND